MKLGNWVHDRLLVLGACDGYLAFTGVLGFAYDTPPIDGTQHDWERDGFQVRDVAWLV